MSAAFLEPTRSDNPFSSALLGFPELGDDLPQNSSSLPGFLSLTSLMSELPSGDSTDHDLSGDRASSRSSEPVVIESRVAGRKRNRDELEEPSTSSFWSLIQGSRQFSEMFAPQDDESDEDSLITSTSDDEDHPVEPRFTTGFLIRPPFAIPRGNRSPDDFEDEGAAFVVAEDNEADDSLISEVDEEEERHPRRNIRLGSF